MELLKKIEDLVAPLVGLTTASDDKEKSLPEVTDPEGIVEDEYCMDGRKDVGTPAEIAKERSELDLSKCSGYKLSDVKETSSGLTATLTLAGPAADLYGEDVHDLTIEVEYETASRLRVHIYDTAGKQFQIPEDILPRCSSQSTSSQSSELKFEYTSSPFAFWISRRSSGDVIFDTRSSSPLVFSDHFLHITSKLPSEANVYGPSEIVSESGFRRDPKGSHSTIWTRDAGTPVHENIYGAHPFYMETRYPSAGIAAGASGSKSHGVFLRNSHGMDVSQTPESMTFNVIGGTLDFYFIAGPSQQDVVRQYADIVGLPARQPFWAFGLHLCRWNRDDDKGEWGTPEGVKQIVHKMKEAGVPLETIWSDLDYMDKVRNWDSNEKWSPEKYKSLIDQLHAQDQHYVPIIDAAIGISDPKDKTDKYFAYEKGTELDVWVKDQDGKTYVGEVWPGPTVFPDWTHPKTDEWWKACFDKYRTYAPYDGIWLDMNEPASFQEDRPVPKELNPYDFPKYKIDNGYGALWEKTLAPSAKLADGSRHYHQHNLFGHCENISTRKLLLEQEPEKRPFIITRSTFAGTGKLSGHWLGDNYSTWTSMRNSIQGILMFQMFQIPMVGPDACGFSGDCTEELANRWMQLGAFYPFFRNHNVEQAKPQEPFRWPSVAEASKKAIDVRYRLLPYWETLFAQASKTGTPPIRPLSWEFDELKYAPVHEQFLVGPSILVTPVLKRGGKQVTGYLPKAGGPWRDWWTHKAVETDADDKATLPTPLGSINVHIRAGSALLVHNKSEYTLTDTKKGSYGLIVSLDDEGKAQGEAIIDDGLTNESKTTQVTFIASPSGVKINGSGDFAAPKLTSITVLGLSKDIAHVTVGEEQVQISKGENSVRLELSVDLRESVEVKF